MKEKWNTVEDKSQTFSGQPVGLLYSYDTDHKWNRPSKLPSTRAIFNYNNAHLTSSGSNTNYIFSGDEDSIPVTSASMPNSPLPDSGMTPGRKSAPVVGGFDTLGVEQIQGHETTANGMSDTATVVGSERTDFTSGGSTTKLIGHGGSKWGCKFKSWPSSLERGLSCISLAACFGNISRLPSMVAQHGGAPFLVAYALLITLVGAPLVFLELGVGQIVQQGVTRTWRAVPMFRGVAYIKLVVNMFLCIYYPMYIGLALFYLTWLAKEQLPFVECAVAKKTDTGYRTSGIPGEQCLNKTFLESPLVDSKWFGINTAFIALIWIIIMLCSFRRIKAYIRSMNCFFIPIFICMFALLVKAAITEPQNRSFYNNIDWTILQNAEVWYYATIQLFFSTHLGFGNVVTCAGKVYNKADPFWATLAYMLVNITLGILSVSTCYLLMGDALPLSTSTHITSELYLFNAIYDHAVLHSETSYSWTVLAYLTILLSGFVSMLAVVFTILKAIRVETKNKWQWWHTAAMFCFVFFALGVLASLVPNFKIVHLLDHYIIGNLLLICTILEVAAFVYIYGCSNIYIDFEFILGSSLTSVWKLLWWLSPIILLTVFIWALATIRLTGIFNDDPLWMYATGWTIVVLCVIVILVIAVYEVYIQVDYNFVQKLTSALKPSRKWGPVDPMLRHGWIQWRSTAGSGGRDFTLKRRGTRDYTHSVKNRAGARFTNTLNTNSDTATAPVLSSPSFEQNGGKRHPLEIVSITDTLERNDKPRLLPHSGYFHDSDNKYNNNYPVLNPLGVPSMYADTTTIDSNSEGYGTIRNGPYVIANGEFDHVCWRKTAHEEATEL